MIWPAVTQAEQPLSVIDWLSDHQPETVQPIAQPAKPNPSEPPVTSSATAPQVSVTTLGTTTQRLVGIVPPDVTGLPTTLWQGSEPGVLASLIAAQSEDALPALQSLLYTVLLTEAVADSRDDTLLLARADKLAALGALEPALALLNQAGPTATPARFARWFDASLLLGQEDVPCRALQTTPTLTDDFPTRVFCLARAGDWQAAALTLDNARVLGLVSEQTDGLLARFLDPELFDTPAQPPTQPTALEFRMLEAIGEPLSTASLPRRFATADLRDVAGWKAQLEAAERLTRTGALPDNRLLGIYTDRLPAASGGVWDRVRAVQRLETAMNTKSSEAVAKSLPPALRAMRQAHLEVPFASLMSSDLSSFDLTGQAAQLAQLMALLSPDYETAGRAMTPTTPQQALLRAIALGDMTGFTPASPQARAIADAFSTSPAPQAIVTLAQNGQLGEAILRSAQMFHQGAKGDLQRLTDGLAGLRSLGLEDVARRGSLQLVVLNWSL